MLFITSLCFMHAFFCECTGVCQSVVSLLCKRARCQKGMGHRHSKTEHVHQSALQGVPVSKVSIGIACLFNFTWNLENLPYQIYSYILILLHEIHTAMQSSLSSESNHYIKMLSVCPTSGERGMSWHEKVREQEDTYTNTQTQRRS